MTAQQPRPKSIPRTSETELHLMGNLLDRHKDKLFYATEKLDGFSFSFGRIDGEFVASNRDRRIDLSESSPFASAIKDLDIEGQLSIALISYCWCEKDVIIQGELIGPSIRGNRYKLEDLKFYTFDVIVDGKRLSLDEARKFAEVAGLEWVPVIAHGFAATTGLCTSVACGFSQLGNVAREGIVCRTMTETFDEYQGRVSFKVFNPDYPFHH